MALALGARIIGGSNPSSPTNIMITLKRKCNCSNLLTVHLDTKNDKAVMSLKGCFFYSNKYKLQVKHLENTYRIDLGWSGPYQTFVYCNRCGSRKYLCVFSQADNGSGL